jgi:cellulose synthase/poly-beta-1,6-N-acetylglucosamine synthase-like glycosyltransferase
VKQLRELGGWDPYNVTEDADLGVRISRKGISLTVRVKGGEIVLRVKKLVDKDQAWFWTSRWQEGEREAEEDIRTGRIHSFARAKEAVAFLHRRAKKGSGAIHKV